MILGVVITHLKESYPELSSIMVDKDLLVYSCLELAVGGGSSSWNVRFVCRFNDWKLESVRSFFDILYSNIPSRGVHDHLGGNRKFDVKSYYEVIRGSNDVRFP